MIRDRDYSYDVVMYCCCLLFVRGWILQELQGSMRECAETWTAACVLLVVSTSG